MKPPFAYFCKFFAFPTMGLFTQKIEGRENIPRENGFIVASNHINSLDQWFVGNSLREKTKFLSFVVAMDSLTTVLYSGLLYYFAEAIIVNRKKDRREDMLEKMIRNLKNKKVIIFFPEGNTNRKKELLRGKTGVAELALRAKVPVIPLGMRKAKNSFRRIIEVGSPLHFSEELELSKQAKNNKEEYYLLLRKVTDEIMQEISKLCQKPYRH